MMAAGMKTDSAGLVPLVGLDGESVRSLCSDLDLKPFQLREIPAWIYSRRSLSPAAWTTLPLAAREVLVRRCAPGLPTVVDVLSSSDGTRKYLLRLEDGSTIESVFIPDGERRTLCISSQAGCAMGCAFCLTATLGLRRNLTAGEILGQVMVLERRESLEEGSYNVVFMGMGEPLANRANLEKALAVLEDTKWGMGLSKRRITVSTCGLADALETFAASPLCPRLSISLNAARDDLRSSLMPVNERYPLERLRAVLQGLSRRHRERTSLEYVLLGGVNDTRDHALRLARFANGLKVKVNLIPFNAGGSLSFRTADPAVAKAFQRVLLDAEIPTSIRRSRGADILAACGQLAAGKASMEGGK